MRIKAEKKEKVKQGFSELKVKAQGIRVEAKQKKEFHCQERDVLLKKVNFVLLAIEKRKVAKSPSYELAKQFQAKIDT